MNKTAKLQLKQLQQVKPTKTIFSPEDTTLQECFSLDWREETQALERILKPLIDLENLQGEKIS